MNLLDGKLVSNQIKENVKEKVEEIISKYKKTPTLAVVMVGENPASQVYVRNKIKACEKVGINSIHVVLPETITQQELEEKVQELAKNDEINGILVQLPLPDQFDKDPVIELIPQNKDVDGLTKGNVADLVLGEEGIVPCTPKGVMDILKYYNIGVEGKKVAIIGRSMLVGKPLFSLMTNANATVTLCHSKTKDIEKTTSDADIVVCALGKAKFLKENMIKEGAVVIDVGINKTEEGLVGDADFDTLKEKASYITPVPGGCGPMTVAELLNNTIECFYKQQS